MVDQWTEAFAEAVAAVPKNKIEITSVEIIHSKILDEEGNPTTVRAVNNTEDMDLPLESSAPFNPSETVLFKGIPFEMSYPEIEDMRVPAVTVKIDGIGREVSKHLDEAVMIREAITVILRGHIYNIDTKTVVISHDPIRFQMRAVTVNDLFVSGQASPRDLANKRAMGYVYDLQNYPGINMI